MSDIEIVVQEEADITITVDTATAYVIEVPGVGAASIITTKGDLLVYSTIPNRLPIGTNGQVLTADSTDEDGLKWADLPVVETNKIFQANTSVEIIDTAAGVITTTVDGTIRSTINSSGQSFAVGARVNEYSTDGTLGGNSDTALPTEKAVKTYVDNKTRDKIIEGDSSVEVTDTGNGTVTTTVDGYTRSTVTKDGLMLTTGNRVLMFDEDTALAANATNRVPTQRAIKTYVDGVAGVQDKIEEGNTSVEVIDAGTGSIMSLVDGVQASNLNGLGLVLSAGSRINRFDDDVTLAADSNSRIATQLAVKAYVAAQGHTRLHTMTSTADHSAGNWKLFYSNGSGEVNELALTSTAYFLRGGGTTAAPVWALPHPLTTKGDLFTYASSSVGERLPVGTNDYVLTADSAQATGLKWAVAPNGDKIVEGNTSVEVVDTGTGYVSTVIDGTEYVRSSAAKQLDMVNMTETAYPCGLFSNGSLALYVDTTNENRSTVVGYNNGGSASYGSFRTWQTLCFGELAGYSITTGSDNCLMGVQAGAYITTGTKNTCVGTRSGFYENIDSTVCIGYYSGYFIDGHSNVVIGPQAGFGVQNTTFASRNVFIGREAGTAVRAAENNVLIGHNCGATLQNFDNKFYLENSNDITNPLLYGEFGNEAATKLCIGVAVPRTTANGLTVNGEVVPSTDDTYDLGNASYRWDDVYATNTTIQTSDERLKTDIVDSSLGLDFICKIRPVSYKWKDKTITGVDVVMEDYEDESEWFLDLSEGIEKLESMIDKDESYEIVGDKYRIYRTVTRARKIETPYERVKTYSRTHYGMIAQEVEQTISGIGKTNTDFAGIIHNEENDIYGLRYGEFIAPLIKAVQEQQVMIDKLMKRVEELEGR